MSDNKDQSNNEWKSREMGALWRREGKQQNFLSGLIKTQDEFGMEKETKVVVFTNKGKAKNEKAPDFIIYEDKPREQPSQTQTSQDEEEVPAGF